MSKIADAEILARIVPSQGRRVIALASLAGLGGVVIWIAVMQPPGQLWAVVLLILFGAACLWLADLLRRSTQGGLVLTEAGLCDAEGVLLAPVEQMVAVSRGAFALRPSNGFLLTLDRSAPARWAPGLWWRIGRRIGVGGVISGAEGRFMAERIHLILAERGRG